MTPCHRKLQGWSGLELQSPSNIKACMWSFHVLRLYTVSVIIVLLKKHNAKLCTKFYNRTKADHQLFFQDFFLHDNCFANRCRAMRPNKEQLPAGVLLHELGAVSSVVRQVSAAEHPAGPVHASHLRVRHNDGQQTAGVRVERRV